MERITITSRRYHMRYHTFPISLAWFGGYLQRVTTRYRQIYKKMYMSVFLQIWKIDLHYYVINRQ